MTTQDNQEEQQIPVTDSDWQELFRRMPHVRNELNIIVNTRIAFEMQNKEIEDLRKQVKDMDEIIKDDDVRELTDLPSINSKKPDRVVTG
tara:strand:+ start:102 stop:371 length:270 start_codon:yes stop_codon:yes gene_type:complete